MKLLIAIPALNEEDSITEVIERTLAAREIIMRDSPVTEVEITVVSDGSTDATVERAEAFGKQIRLVVFPKNHGYGAAIKTAWLESDADIMGVLDADGTCDPLVFVPLCQAAARSGADVVVGCRLSAGSHMPWVRWLGNTIFALMLSAFSSRLVRDVASGMRVVRRTSLPALLPLPDGMQFTPAMSARALLSRDLRIIEVDIPYAERVGRSKLRVISDGLRFFRVIIEAAFLYRPARPLAALGAGALLIAAALMMTPTLYYLDHRKVAEWMIYRFVVSSLLTSSGLLLLVCAYLTHRIVGLVLYDPGDPTPMPRQTWGQLLAFWSVPVGLTIVGGVLVWPSFLDLVRTGSTYEHWSRFLAMSCLLSCALILIVGKTFDYTLHLLAARVAYLRRVVRSVQPPTR